jgi:hypothetical protein
VSVTTPPAQDVDPRRTGVHKNGSYWGGGGEQIDTLSGNVNFALPLLTTQQRTGQQFPLGLSYDSQNWRQDSSFNWQLGNDTGYGFGWKLQFGSVTPYYNQDWVVVDHYVFTDGSGADYRLDVYNGYVWSSSQSAYVWFDASVGRLHFSDGSFWEMGCMSGGLEQDAGTMYPNVLEDSNGNQIVIQYNAGEGLPSTDTNTSARIAAIYDFRETSPAIAYTFTYSTASGSPIPHLASIANTIGTPENYTLSYSSPQQLIA